MKKKPTKRTNWKQKYEALSQDYNAAERERVKKSNELNHLKQACTLLGLKLDGCNITFAKSSSGIMSGDKLMAISEREYEQLKQELKEREDRNLAQSKIIEADETYIEHICLKRRQLKHTLTILTQTGIATPEQCEIARRLAETIVKDEVPKQEGFKGLPYQVVPSGNWKGLDRKEFQSFNRNKWDMLNQPCLDKDEPTQEENPSRLKSALTGVLQGVAGAVKQDWMTGLGGAVAGSKACEIYPTDRQIAFEPKKEGE